MTAALSAEFWITATLVTATPGTGALFTIAAALASGRAVGLVAALGCTLGIVPHLVLALTGAAALLVASPVALEVVRWLGVAYLVYLAWGTWRQGLSPRDEPEQRSWARLLRDAVAINLLNPKLTLFFFVFLPLFVEPSAPDAILTMTLLGGAFMALTFVIFGAYALAAAWLRPAVVSRPRVAAWVSRGFAVAFVLLALALALTKL